MSKPSLETLTSLAKRRGFIYQGSEIYGGLAGTWDWGPLGVQLKRNLQDLWWRMFVLERDDVWGLDSAVLMNQQVWQASGHTGAGFADPLVEDTVTKKRYRADHLLEECGVKNVEALSLKEINAVIKKQGIKSPNGNELSPARQFNLMFATNAGAVADDSTRVYLRPETAQGIFVNFKNIVDSFYPDLPFGIAQMGKAFRNEISPRELVFRAREFEIMELEYFIRAEEWEQHFAHWQEQFYRWAAALGLDKQKLHELEVPPADRAHYSRRTIDFEYEFSFGTKEIAAVAYRTDFDLANHQQHSSKNLEYVHKGSNERLIPHVVEPTWGVERNLLAVLSEAYTEAEVEGEKRVYLKLPARLAPVKVAMFPLLKNKPKLVKAAREIYGQLQQSIGAVMWDDNGNIGKRYRRQDEIGTPYCVTFDFDSLDDGAVTVRERDSMRQERVKIAELTAQLTERLNS